MELIAGGDASIREPHRRQRAVHHRAGLIEHAELKIGVLDVSIERKGGVERESRVGGYDSWWNVPVAEVSNSGTVRDARAAYETARRKERDFL